MKKWWKKSLHYRTKLTLALIGVVLVPVIISICLYYIFVVQYNHNQIFQEYRTWADDRAVDIQEKAHAILEEMSRFESESTPRDYLKAPERYNLTRKMEVFRANQSILFAVESEIAPYTAQRIRVYGRHITQGSVIPGPMYAFENLERENPQVVEALEAHPENETLYVFSPSESADPSQACLTMYQQSRDLYGELLAVNEIRLSFSCLSAAAEFPTEEGFLFYQSDADIPVLLQSQQRSQEECLRAYAAYDGSQGTSRAGEYFVIASELTYSSSTLKSPEEGDNDRLLFFFPQSAVYQSERAFLLNAGLIAALAIAVIIITIREVSRMLTKRLYQLLEEISVNTETLMNSQGKQPEVKDDEFGQIEAKFWEIAQQLRAYSQKALRAEYEKKLLRTELMQDLIAPHFLYNTLDGMRWSTDDPNLIRVIDNMVNFYRIALNKGDLFVTMTQEFDMVHSYLEVQRFAYESEFRYHLHMDDSLREVRILKHIIQPVVENALVHGIDKREDRGFLSISARKNGEAMEIEVTDNGAGMTQETIQNLLQGTSKIGYGIHNVIQRIALVYGDGYGLAIQSQVGKGTAVLVTLPLETSEFLLEEKEKTEPETTGGSEA